MAFHGRYLGGCAALALAAVLAASPTHAQDAAALNAEAAGNDWSTHHGTYKSYHYSGLEQINADNVKNLEVAWMHFPERATRGLQSTPLAMDGVLYYSGSYSRVYALDGATGKTLWTYAPELATKNWSPSRRTRRTTAASHSDRAISMSARSTAA
jgi:Glucose dehydrogenase